MRCQLFLLLLFQFPEVLVRCQPGRATFPAPSFRPWSLFVGNVGGVVGVAAAEVLIAMVVEVGSFEPFESKTTVIVRD